MNEKFVTCGDSLNDLPLFESGFKSVAVGNSESALVSSIEKMDNIYLSQFLGISGIIDGVNYFQSQAS